MREKFKALLQRVSSARVSRTLWVLFIEWPLGSLYLVATSLVAFVVGQFLNILSALNKIIQIWK